MLSLGLFLLGISNYFFILTAGVFGVCYAGFRYFQTIKERNVKTNFLVIGLGIVGFAVGIGMSCFCNLPAIVGSFSIQRANESNYLSYILELLKQGKFSEFFNVFFK